MPLSDLIRLGTANATSGDLATFALQADQQRRRALRAGDLAQAAAYAAESGRLADQSLARSRG